MLELFVLFCVRFHRNEISSGHKFSIASMEENCGVQKSFLIEFNGKTKHRAGKGWTGKPLHHN